MRRFSPKQAVQRRRGAAMVEFAIIAPLFLTLLLGTFESGKALETSNLLSAAVREGGRLASMDWRGTVPDGMTINQKVIDDIRNFLQASDFPADDVNISITSAEGIDAGETFDLADTDNRLRLFRISAVIPYSAVSTYPSTFMAGKDVTASMVYRAGRIRMAN